VNEQKILHLDADAFFASVEQAADPRLRGRPVAVGGAKRGVVASASYEARRMGIYTTMPTARARKLCPSLVIVAGDFEKYERFSRLLFSYVYDFTPTVEVSSIDEGYANLTGNRRTSAGDIAETIRRVVRQTLKITLSEGIGSNKLVSAVASKLKKPDALIIVPPGGEREFLAPLEAKWLPGVGPKLAEEFRRAGLPRIGNIAETPPEQLALFAGNQAVTLWEMARGIDSRLVIPDPPAAKSLGEQETFEHDSADEHFARARLRQMADRLLSKLRAGQLTARTMEVRIRYNDFDEARRSESFPEPTNLESDVYPIIDRLLRRAWERRVSLRLVGLKFSNLYDAKFQDTLALEWRPESGEQRPESGNQKPETKENRGKHARQAEVPRGRRYEVAGAVDRIRETYGQSAILRGHDLFLKTGERNAERGKKVSAFPSPVSALNLRSSFSFLDSLLSPEAAVREAAERGAKIVALTDPNLHGAVAFSQAAMEAGVRPVIAAEILWKGKPVLAYVKNQTGYENLCAILSETEKSGKRRPETGDLKIEPDGLLLVPAEAFPEVRYAEAGEHAMYQILQSIRTLTLLGSRRPDKRRGRFHFREFPTNPAICRQIKEECQFVLPLGGLNFPGYQPADGSSAHDFLARLAREGLHSRYGPKAVRHMAQLNEELQIIASVGYEEYFLLVWDILQECRVAGIDWITRGSAADSLVCYCLGISDVCPIRYELYFKRFLNADRMALNKLPDIDIDFAHDRKDDVVDAIFAKFGVHAAVVGGFSTYQGRSAFADIAKVFGVSESQIRRYTEHLPRTSAARVMEAASASRECAEMDFTENPYATALALAKRLDGFPRHPKMHPCGIVLSRKPVAAMCPLFVSHKGRATTHFDMDAVEAIGLVKMDILAQGGLAVMRDAVEDIQNRNAKTEDRKQKNPVFRTPFGSQAPTLSTPDPSFSDPAVWRMIASGRARGVHHIESPAMTSLNRMVNVNTIDDLIAIVSVIRPGAANTMRKVTFARRAQGLEPVEYAHPSLEPVLRSTYGVVAYEEHILQICEAFAGMPAGRADILRRALVKNQTEKATAFFEEFAGHASRGGRTPEDIRRVWELIMGFQGYAFCRAHSTAYGIEAYQAAWLKCYHPAEFLAAVLTHGKGFYDRLTYSIECRQLGIGFLPPDINHSTDRYVVENKVLGSGLHPSTFNLQPLQTIRVPLTQIKGLSHALIQRWQNEKPFASLQDFFVRTRPSTPEMDAMIRCGAFDGFGISRVEQFWEARRLRLCEPGESLFRAGPPTPAVSLPTDQDFLTRLQDEMDLLGFTVSGHPLDLFPDAAWDTYCPISRLDQFPGQTVRLAGMIVTDRMHRQSDGRPMKFLSLCDPSGIIECELFAGAYARFGIETIRHPLIELSATVQPFENQNGCTLNVRSVRRVRTIGPGKK
jgi:DNA-directed DNA polymerase III PolC